MPIDDPPADRRPHPSGPAGPESVPTYTDADVALGRDTSSAPAGPAGLDADAAAEPPDATPTVGPEQSVAPEQSADPERSARPAQSVDPQQGADAPESAGPTDSSSPDGSVGRRPATAAVPARRDAATYELRPRQPLGTVRPMPLKATPVKATPPRTTRIKATPVVAAPIKPFPIKANPAGTAPVQLGRRQVPPTRSPDAPVTNVPMTTAPPTNPPTTNPPTTNPPTDPPATDDTPTTTLASGDATVAVPGVTPPTTTDPIMNRPGGPPDKTDKSDETGDRTDRTDSLVAMAGRSSAAFTRGVAPVGWHPPMAYPPSAPVSPAPMEEFGAPGGPFTLTEDVPPPRRRTGLLVTTSALAVLFLLVSAGLAFAFVNRNNAYHKQVTTVTRRDATIAGNVSQINDLKSKLAAAQARSQQLQRQIADSASRVTELQQEKTVLGTCINSINNFFTVVGENGTAAEQSTAQTTMEADCTAAQKYLN